MTDETSAYIENLGAIRKLLPSEPTDELDGDIDYLDETPVELEGKDDDESEIVDVGGSESRWYKPPGAPETVHHYQYERDAEGGLRITLSYPQANHGIPVWKFVPEQVSKSVWAKEVTFTVHPNGEMDLSYEFDEERKVFAVEDPVTQELVAQDALTALEQGETKPIPASS